LTLPMCRKRAFLVLGSSGKLGKMLRHHWRDFPAEDRAIYWQYRENPLDEGVRWQPGAPMPGKLPKVDAIVALWGVTPGPGRVLAENRLLALQAMELAQVIGATRVLHCSSAAVYPPGPDPLTEEDAGGDINAYGTAKLAMEAALAEWAKAHPAGPKSCAMRIANVVGADSLFAAIKRGDGPITLDRFDDGEGPRRSYVTVSVLARSIEALLACSEADLPDVVNVATPGPVAMAALAQAAGCDIAWRPAPKAAAPMVALDTTRLGKLVPLVSDTPAEMVAAWRRLEPEA